MTLPVPVNATFLRTNQDPGASFGTTASLASLNLEAGDRVRLRSKSQGLVYFCINHTCAYENPGIVAAFTTGPAPPAAPALATGLPEFETAPTGIGGFPTAVPNLFLVPGFEGAEMTIPAGATAIWFAMADAWYTDNEGFLDLIIEELDRACSVPPLAPIVDAEARALEDSNGVPPTDYQFPARIDAILDSRAQTMEALLRASRPAVHLARTSGYRPLAYQRHLFNIRTTHREIVDAVERDPKQAVACAALWDRVTREAVRHGLILGSGGEYQVAEFSLHARTPALALDMSISNLPQEDIDKYAGKAGLVRPLKDGDPVHFTTREARKPYVMEGKIRKQTQKSVPATNSGDLDVVLVMIDPLGRRVGLDRATAQPVNEIGPAATYSGAGSSHQYVRVVAGVEGIYRLTAWGVSGTPYEMTLSREDESGALIESVIGSSIPDLAGGLGTLALQSPATMLMDVLPNSEENCVNPRSSGNMAVTIMSGARPVNEIDPSSLRLGVKGTEPSYVSCKSGMSDRSANGQPDLTCKFSIPATGLSPGVSQLRLTGNFRDGQRFEALDWIDTRGTAEPADEEGGNRRCD